MATFLLYIIKSSCCLVLFYLGYKTLLSHESCFRFNRKVLIGGMIVCMLLPLAKLKTATPGFIHQPFIELERMINPEEAASIPLPDLITADVPTDMPTEKTFSPWIIITIYLTGGILMLLWLLRSFASLYLLIHGSARIRTGGYVLVVLDRPTPPFNWWKYIILSDTDYQSHPDEIIAHEVAHCRRRHSLDLAFVECIILFHWFNPAAWLLKRELRDVHEYEADTEVLKSGINATRYQLLLVKKAVGSSSYTLANSFNQSKLKKRITMMCVKKSNKWARWKLVLLIPVAASTLYAFARPDVNRQFEQLIPSESTTIPQDNKQIPPEMTNNEMNTKIQSLPDSERMKWLQANSNPVTLFVNAKADILCNNDYTSRQQLLAKLSESLCADYKNTKPVIIYCLYDRATPALAVDSIRQIAIEAVERNVTFINSVKRDVYIVEGDPRQYGNRQKSNDTVSRKGDPVIVVFYEGSEPSTSLAIYGDNTIQVKSYMEKKGLEHVTLVEIKAPPKTSMGKIGDVKTAIHQLFEENGVDTTNIQFKYRMQQTIPAG